MKPKFITENIDEDQTAFNIAKLVKRAIVNSTAAADEIAHQFDSKYIDDVCRNIYNFCRSRMPYKKEGAKLQTSKELPVIMHNLDKKMFDCKHYATFAACILHALDIPFKLKLISQNYYDKEPTHVYVIAYDNGVPIVVDPCISRFNDEARYNYRYTVNNLYKKK